MFRCPPIAKFGFRILAILAVTAFVSLPAYARDIGQWSPDLEQAQNAAGATGKDMLLFFTGSDWCPPCQKLELEVFENDEFWPEALQHYVFVKFDFPQTIKLSEEIAARNDKMRDQFGVTGYPTIVMVDAEMKPVAFAGYEEGGFQNFLAMMEETRQLRINRDEKMKLAAATKGTDRARLLDEAISGMREEVAEVYYADVIAEIVELDADDALGLRMKWNGETEAELRKVVMTDIAMAARLETPERAAAFIDETMAANNFTAAQRLAILQIKLNVVRKLDDPQQVDGVLDQMIGIEELLPETRDRLQVRKVLLMTGSNRSAEAMSLLEKLIEEGQDDGRASPWLWVAKGDLLQGDKDYPASIAAYDRAIAASKMMPDLQVEAVSGKADAQYADARPKEALQTLDGFVDNAAMPEDLRAETLLHKSILMRAAGSQRTARLTENRAVEMVTSPKLRAEMQQVVQRLRESE